MPTQPTCPMPPFLELEPDTRIRHCYQLASLFVCLCLSHMLLLLLVGQCATQSTGTSEQVRPPPSTKANCPQRPTLFRLLAVALPLSSSMGGQYQMHFGHYHHTITVCMFCSFHYGSSCGFAKVHLWTKDQIAFVAFKMSSLAAAVVAWSEHSLLASLAKQTDPSRFLLCFPNLVHLIRLKLNPAKVVCGFFMRFSSENKPQEKF